ncbi:transcription initiation factor IIF, beta subunit-domain-containing protein [Xylariales sp. PMI_506]|nr:transcription initiation factor IIF, beta subunit-domain-containing protein [Xylariales sp. PMI_506]
MAAVKTEPGIKPDPEDTKPSPAALSDDDLYEDAGDLEYYDPNIPQDPYGTAYLAHIPKYLYEQWAQLGEGEELVIGKVRTWTETDKSGQPKHRMAMLVDPRNPVHQTVPKEYNLELKETNLLNTFMFTEQDLPGFKNKYQGGPNSDIPAHLRPRPERPKENGQPEAGRRRGRREPYYRKAIPKKTTLAARFRTELNCQPVMNAETKHILAMRASDALKPKATTSMMTGTRNPSGIIHAGSMLGNEKMRGFVAKSKKQKEERAARLDQSVLRDAIFACYDEFRYWTMKAFKNRLNQPEAWLRENLEEVAVMHKSGRFANHWELKPEYRRANVEVGEEAAPDAGGAADDDEDGDDDDENVQMEDVI